MFSSPVILVGINDEVLPELRRELHRDQALVEGSFAHAGQALDSLRSPAARNSRRLIIIDWKDENDSQSIKRLGDALPGWPILALVEQSDEPLNLLQAYRSGASQVVALAFDSRELHDALIHLDRQYGENEHEHRVIAVSGAREGLAPRR
jgi:hypothetical protein